jgi:hypothetical protein
MRRQKEFQKAFDHTNCSVMIDKRKNISVRGELGLRYLRHRFGYKDDPHFASCPHCGHKFTYENLVGLYWCRIGGTSTRSVATDVTTLEAVRSPKNCLHAMCIQFQKYVGGTIDPCTQLAINAVYNSHSSAHVSGCFRCQKMAKKLKHVCGSSQDCECRFRLPDRPRKKARIRYVQEDNMWFEWNRVEKKQSIVKVLPKRNIYDLFQNVSALQSQSQS